MGDTIHDMIQGAYPKWKYHPDREAVVVQSAEDEKTLEGHWFDSPAEYGIETCPGRRPNAAIAKRKKVVSVAASVAK